MTGGFQVGPFQVAYQQVGTAVVPDLNGWKPRRRHVVDDVLQDDEDVIRLFADAISTYIKKRMEH